MKKFCLFLLLLALFGCGPKKTRQVPLPVNCPGAHIILPANFIIDLAAGSEIFVDPAIQEFALFCQPDQAREALREQLKAGNLPAGSDWRVYRLRGNFRDLAVPCHGDNFCLGSVTQVEEWLEPENVK